MPRSDIAKHYQGIIDAMEEGVLLINRKQRIMLHNKRSALLLSWADEIDGKDLKSVIDSSDLCKSASSVFSGKKTERITIAVYEGVCGDEAFIKGHGRERTFRIRVTALDEKLAAVTIADITKIERLSLVRQDFVSNVSHELKTPLTSISGYSELIMRDQVDKDHIKEFSTQIYNEARRLYQLIEDIMAISRLDEEAEVTLQDIDVNLIAKDVLDSIANPIVSLKEDSRLRIKGNGTLVFEAIYNLVDNAIKYNRNDNPVTLEIGSNYFAVEDHGIGLSPYDKERVFDRFYRVDKSRSRKTGGTGLGLSIVKSVAERHGARIEINSTLGSGTTIKMVFPPKQFK